LPRVEREFGVRLPPERYCFTGTGWDLKESWEEEVVDAEGDELDIGVAVGIGGPVGGGDAMELEEEDEDQFEEVMGGQGDTTMVDA
jgi:transcription initiation factor TFIID subunit 9B